MRFGIPGLPWRPRPREADVAPVDGDEVVKTPEDAVEAVDASTDRPAESEPTVAPQPTEPTEPPQPTEPARSGEAGKSTEPTTSAEPTAATEASEPDTATGTPGVTAETPSADSVRRPTDKRVLLGRSRLVAALRPRLSAGQLLAALLCGLLGFAAVVQSRSYADAGLTSLSEADLVRVLGEMAARRERVEAETRELRATRERQLAGGGQQEAQDDARRQIQRLSILAGLVPAVGPGVEVTIEDPTAQVRADHLLDAVQELRGAGAEAISVGDVRVVAGTSFVDGAEGILVDGRLVRAPYRIKAIGEPRGLATALDIPGGVTEFLRLDFAAIVAVDQREEVRVDAVREPPERRFAEPLPGEGRR